MGRETLSGQDDMVWREAISKEFKKLGLMKCWETVRRAGKQEVMHTEFVWLKKRDENGHFKWHKAGLVVCGNEEDEYHEENFSPVIDYTVLKLILCTKIEKNWVARHLNLKNTYQNGLLDGPFYIELPKYSWRERERKSKVMKLSPS